jgi:hypothetical protein
MNSEPNNKFTFVVMSLIFFIVLMSIIELKFLAVYTISPVEKDGYYKVIYGLDYYEEQGICYSNEGKQSYTFNEEGFSNYCIKPSLLDFKLFSDCWREGVKS